MYSKREVCFTAIVALAVSWHLGSQRAVTGGEEPGAVVGFADGTHPPPPPWLTNADMLQADGTHPPPPPWLTNADMLQADGTHPPPPPWLTNADMLQADGTHPPPPA